MVVAGKNLHTLRYPTHPGSEGRAGGEAIVIQVLFGMIPAVIRGCITHGGTESE